MRIFYLIENNKFKGFFYENDKELYKEDNELKDNAYEIDEAQYNELINSMGVIVWEEGKLKLVEQPSNMIKPFFDAEKNMFVESVTKEELMLKRKNLIIEYKKVKEEIVILEEFADEFESTETIKLLKEKQTNIKNEINELLKIIKTIQE